MSRLFSSFRLGALELPNRIVIAPMCQYSAQEGHPSDWHLLHWGSMALSGAGMLIVEATAVTPEGRITPGCLGLWSDAHAESLARSLAPVRRQGVIPLAIQLSHAGRKALSRVPWEGGAQIPVEEGGWLALAPSPLPHAPGELPPQELDAAGLSRIREAFVAAARRAVDCGLQAIELHMAHGYLLHEFLSPLSNQRSDAYGGSLEHRMRFPLEVFRAVRDAVPERIPVGVRISATDWVEGGWNLEQSIVLAQAIEPLGCAYIHVSSGGLSPLQKIPVAPGYQVPFAEAVRRAVKHMPVIAVGLITEPQQAEAILAEEKADLVALARMMVWDPRWPWHAAAALGATVEAPPQYWRCQPQQHRGVFGDVKIGQR